MLRPDVVSAAHCHAPYGTAFSATVTGRAPIAQEARMVFEATRSSRTRAAAGSAIFDLGFHAVMFRGDDPELEKHCVPTRSQRTRSAPTLSPKTAPPTTWSAPTPACLKPDRSGRSWPLHRVASKCQRTF